MIHLFLLYYYKYILRKCSQLKLMPGLFSKWYLSKLIHLFFFLGNVATIALAPSGPTAGTEVYLSGWGHVRDTQLGSNNELRFVQVTVGEASLCEEYYGPFPENQICVDTSGNKSSCEVKTTEIDKKNDIFMFFPRWKNVCIEWYSCVNYFYIPM